MRAFSTATGLFFVCFGLFSGCASENDDCDVLCESVDGAMPKDASTDGDLADMSDASADAGTRADASPAVDMATDLVDAFVNIDMTAMLPDASSDAFVELDMAVVSFDAFVAADMDVVGVVDAEVFDAESDAGLDAAPDAEPDAAPDAHVPTCVDDPSLCAGFTYCDTASASCEAGCSGDEACDVNEVCDAAHECVCAEGTILVRGACKTIEACDIDAVVTTDDEVTDILHCSLLRSLTVSAGSTVTSLVLPVLASVTVDVNVKQSPASETPYLTEIDFPSLQSIGADFDVQYNPLLSFIDAPELETVGGELLVLFSGEDTTSMEASFASLTSVGQRFGFYKLPSLVSVSAPRLDNVGTNLVVSTCGDLVDLMTIDFTSFRAGNVNAAPAATTYFEVDFNPSLREARFPALTTFNAYVLIGANGTNVDSFEAEIPLLTDIEQADITGNTTMTLLDLSSLETIDGFFYFGLNGSMDTPLVVRFGSLQRTGQIQVGRCTMESLDLSGIESWSSIAVSSNPLLTELDVAGSHAAGVSIPGGASATANPKLCALTGMITAGVGRTPFVYSPPTGCVD